VELWDAPSGQRLQTLPSHAGRVYAAAFSSDGSVLACGSEGGAVLLWDPRSGAFLRQIEPNHGAADTLAFSPDGQTLATAYFSSKVVDLWHVSSGDHVTELGRTAGPVNCLAWSHDGDLLASGGGVAQVWRPSSGRIDRQLRTTGSSLAWLREGITLAAGARGDVEIWDIPTNSIQRIFPGAFGTIRSTAWSADGKMLATGSDDGVVCVWHSTADEPAYVYRDHPSHVYRLRWLANGKRLAAGSFEHVTLRDMESGNLLTTVPGRCGDFSPDGQLAALQGPSIVPLHGLEDGQLLRTLVALNSGQWAVVSPEGHWRGSKNIGDELVYVVETSDGQKVLTPDEFATQYGWNNKPDQGTR
jgi:WD40 repeat protein